jgi:molecular chaperone DnaK
MGGDRHENRRRHPRAPMALLIQYRFNTLEDFLAEYVTNVSPGGMFILSAAPPPVGTTLHLQFSLKDGSKLIDGLAKVVRQVAVATPESPAGMGVEFVELTPEARAIVQKMVEGALGKR